MSVLFVDACVRDDSRTRRIALELLDRLAGDRQVLRLADMELQPLSAQTLEKRTELLGRGEYSHPAFGLARQFAAADTVVVAAPYWDLSFPSLLKIYFENVYAVGIVSRYGPDGVPVGLCRANKLYYVTTAGGPYVSDFSYGYVKALAACFGIPGTVLVKAEMLDVAGFDAERIVADAVASLDGLIG